MLSFYHLTASYFNYPMCSSCERELNAKKKKFWVNIALFQKLAIQELFPIQIL